MKTDIKQGDIWDFTTDNGNISCLVLAKEKGTVTIIKLFDEWKDDSDVEVNALGTIKYGCTARISYIIDSRATRLIRELKNQEWRRVQDSLVKRFGIEAMPQEAPEPQVIEKVVEVPVNTETGAKIQELRETIKDLEEADGKLSQARTARFIGRYMDVLGI